MQNKVLKINKILTIYNILLALTIFVSLQQIVCYEKNGKKTQLIFIL